VALDLRTARMRKDPTLLVNPIKKESWKRGHPPLFHLSLHRSSPLDAPTRPRAERRHADPNYPICIGARRLV
jgi:hypothetical protein